MIDRTLLPNAPTAQPARSPYDVPQAALDLSRSSGTPYYPTPQEIDAEVGRLLASNNGLQRMDAVMMRHMATQNLIAAKKGFNAAMNPKPAAPAPVAAPLPAPSPQPGADSSPFQGYRSDGSYFVKVGNDYVPRYKLEQGMLDVESKRSMAEMERKLAALELRRREAEIDAAIRRLQGLPPQQSPASPSEPASPPASPAEPWPFKDFSQDEYMSWIKGTPEGQDYAFQLHRNGAQYPFLPRPESPPPMQKIMEFAVPKRTPVSRVNPSAAQPTPTPSPGTPYNPLATPPTPVDETGFQPNYSRYGEFVGKELPFPPTDFIDTDGDGIDDRWQRGPGQPAEKGQSAPKQRVYSSQEQEFKDKQKRRPPAGPTTSLPPTEAYKAWR